MLSSLMCISSWAAASSDVVINEIAWMGTSANPSDEWIELYNTTAMPIDIQEWSIYGADTGVCLNFSDADGHTTWSIPAHGYLIYANRLNDVKDSYGNGMVDIWDLTIGMNNTSPGQLVLYDGQDCTGNVIDIANQTSGDWFAGDASTRKAMERKVPSVSGEDPSNWASNDPGIAANGFDANVDPLSATPGARNSVTNAPPIANAGLNQIVLRGCAVQLDGSASFDPDGDPLGYTWSFVSMPIGSTSSFSDPIAINPTFFPDRHGGYRIELIVEDDHGGSNAAQVVIDVLSPPAADFSYTPDCPTTWDVVCFSDQSSDPDGTIVAWSWDFGDGTLSSEQNPSHRYRLPGAYTCTLDVTDDDELVHSFACGITILSPPAADFSYAPDCPTTWDVVWFSDQSSDPDGIIVVWSWDFGDGTLSSEQNPSHRYGLPGTYTCTLEVTDDDGLMNSLACGITILLGAGDVDGDEIINLLDVRLCLQIATGAISGTADQRAAADVDGDGNVDVADAQQLAKYVMGIEDEL